ncbi:hypothetical protein [Oleiagrimonas sp. MCCC 1A03011]|uniref:hypothetical protein n=1 Tax=Oleiagrimonas sp. MCCC 1A03011 TaxID=1926883 RepID=UPI000DC231CF|nr:hypothetical protein [Oleiagrimonas sp. MCCC 1A03011]RAP59171.1 hypothetical protein BTJ49_00300 [Oleiagrimonas sp. MCCC 1A03011]
MNAVAIGVPDAEERVSVDATDVVCMRADVLSVSDVLAASPEDEIEDEVEVETVTDGDSDAGAVVDAGPDVETGIGTAAATWIGDDEVGDDEAASACTSLTSKETGRPTKRHCRENGPQNVEAVSASAT